MKVSGILETALGVADPVKSASFYRRLFGFATLLETEKLIALNVADRNVLLLFRKGATDQPAVLPGGIIPAHGASGRSHLAFAIEADEVEPWQERLAAEGVAIESVVNWPGGARSLYFRDPDEHLLELLSAGFWVIH